jgi:hypothetical protein
MKQDPPHLSQSDIERLALFGWTVALYLFFLLSMAGGGPDGVGPLQQPLEAPGGLGL